MSLSPVRKKDQPPSSVSEGFAGRQELRHLPQGVRPPSQSWQLDNHLAFGIANRVERLVRAGCAAWLNGLMSFKTLGALAQIGPWRRAAQSGMLRNG